jgi:hypothetical protein
MLDGLRTEDPASDLAALAYTASEACSPSGISEISITPTLSVSFVANLAEIGGGFDGGRPGKGGGSEDPFEAVPLKLRRHPDKK